MASGFTQIGRLKVAEQALNLVSEAALKIVLVDDTYVHDDTRDFVDAGTADDIASHEIAVSGYVGGFGGAGRKVPASRALVRRDPDNRIEFDFADTLWTALAAGVTIGGAALIVEKTADGDSWVVAFDDFVGNVPTDGTDFTYAPSASGVLRF